MVLKPERTPTRNPSRKSPIYRFVTPERAIPLGAVLLIFALWYLSTSLGCANPLFLPTPAAVWSAFVDILQSGYSGHSLLYHLFQSMYRLMAAQCWPLLPPSPWVCYAVSPNSIRAALDPIIEFYRPLPPSLTTPC
ncbi:MAG UNVERIFIED_CONTAM: hypothetical protein LVR29_03300 [Microcystis novacekii LVE1205-3]|jgi:taurine transport system permease protein